MADIIAAVDTITHDLPLAPAQRAAIDHFVASEIYSPTPADTLPFSDHITDFSKRQSGKKHTIAVYLAALLLARNIRVQLPTFPKLAHSHIFEDRIRSLFAHASSMPLQSITVGRTIYLQQSD